ncbi:MAG: hypothetical protein ABW202_03745 [Duganella sp.]
MKKVFVFDGVVVATGVVLSASASVTASNPDARELIVADDHPVAVGWLYKEGEDGEVLFSAPVPPPPTIGPNEFHFLWTVGEQIAIEELRATDTGIKVFMRRLEDPRTTEVVLAAPAIQDAIAYTVNALAAAGVIPQERIAVRIAEIGNGRAASAVKAEQAQ